MRISDWSSDVCSSDLQTHTRTRRCVFAAAAKILHVGLQLDHPHGRMAVAGLSRRSPYSATVRRISPVQNGTPSIEAANRAIAQRRNTFASAACLRINPGNIGSSEIGRAHV